MSLFRIGTYNVQNLFDRFDDPYSVGDDTYGRFRTVPKPRAHLYDMGRRIREQGVPRSNPDHDPIPIDILALQEIENFGALLDFVQGSVGPDYGPSTGVVSLPSNDPRGIDLGLALRTDLFRVGRIISHRFRKFRRSDGRLYQFGRDCLEIEIMDRDQGDRILTVFNCHLKSKYTGKDPISDPDGYAAEQALNTIKRTAEAEEVLRIVRASVDVETDLFAVLGDLNDTPDSPALAALAGPDNPLGLKGVHSLIEQTDTAAASAERRPRDTHFWRRPTASGGAADEWAQIDHILCSPALWALSTGRAGVVNSPRDQGSDHYLSWAEFDLDGPPTG